MTRRACGRGNCLCDFRFEELPIGELVNRYDLGIQAELHNRELWRQTEAQLRQGCCLPPWKSGTVVFNDGIWPST